MSYKNKPRVVALLPMKAHSSRVPGKNFRTLVDKPLFAWILETLTKVTEIDEIIINTDAKSTLESYSITQTSRILIRDRPDTICGDDVSMNKIIADDLNNSHADLYLMTHTTNPLLSADTIARALRLAMVLLDNKKYDSLFSVNRFQSRFYTHQATPINHDPKNLIPTQDLEPWFEENSNLYIFSKNSFFSTNARIGINPYLFETQPSESIDIDSEADWDFAAKLARLSLIQHD